MFINQANLNVNTIVHFGRGSVSLELNMFTNELKLDIRNLKDPQPMDKPISKSEYVGGIITLKFDTIADIDNVIKALELLKDINTRRA